MAGPATLVGDRAGPLYWVSSQPSLMSMLGVPYSPIVPSLTRWISGLISAIADSRFRLPTTSFTWVYTACLRSAIEYGAARLLGEMYDCVRGRSP
jgi:hypothetical protein